MLDFIYYPVSFILWCWHKVFGLVFGEASALSWILGIMFLTFTVRGIMFKPFVKQVRSMRKMQDFAPEIKKIQKKYGNDKQRQAQEMQKLQREHGVNPLGSCLPMLLQIPVFIGLNWVLRAFAYNPEGGQKTQNYFFDQAGVESYNNAKIFGINIGDAIRHMTMMGGTGDGGWHWDVAPVAVPLMIVASIATHFTARHSVARQNPASATQQTAMMNKMTMYVFPAGVLVFGAFFPIGLLIYWLSNNGWTLMQQNIVYKKIDREEEAKKTEAVEKRTALGPKPGQKPGQKPQQKKRSTQSTAGQNGAQESGDAATTSGSGGADKGGSKPGSSGNKPQGTKSDGAKGGTGKSASGKGGPNKGGAKPNPASKNAANKSAASKDAANKDAANKDAASQDGANTNTAANNGGQKSQGTGSNRSSKKTGRKRS